MAFLVRILTGLMLPCMALLCGAAHAAPQSEESIAFYYADHPPVHELSMFSKLVVEPEHLDKSDLQQLKKNGSQVLAYVSIGEVRRDRPWYGELSEDWVLGENKAWNSAIMDMANPQWQAFIIEHLVAPLAEQGYGGVFLDTLDSYQLATNDHGKRILQQQSLIQLIKTLRQRFPDMKILLNRGFDVVPQVHDRVDGVVAESLFQTWNAATRRYGEVPAEAHQWLKNKLDQIHKWYHLPVYVIDYVNPADRALARQTAKEISGLGFIPWVANPQLDMLGVSTLEIVPRHVLVLYDGAESDLPYSQAHRYLPAPLEYMGYVVDYLNVRHALPATSLAGKYAGIITWFSDDNMPSPGRLTNWLMRQMDDGIPIALMNSLGMKPSRVFLNRLGLESIPGKIKRPLRIVHQDALASMEAKPRPLARGLLPLQAVDPYVQVHESIEDARHTRMDVVLTAPWGGMALAPYVVEMGLDQHARWRLDIFRFLQKALHLEPMPVFDTTTENGSRLLMTHIDGDGAASRAVMPGSPLAIRVIRDEILRKYPFPATVSVITSEIEDGGLFPKRAREMQQIARSIFALPNVEIASHTYSHPFNWSRAAMDRHARLDIPGYTYSLEKEVLGSVDYINNHLAPPDKKVKVFLWSGDALPDEKALSLAASIGLRNMNGGNTVATSDHPSLTDISSMLRPVGGQVQVYAPVMNENLYTHNWTKPRYGFERVIETFALTDRPRRLKPIDIYYHFYSGSEIASLNALKRVYDWSMRQQVLPVWVSQYVDKVQAYVQAVAARRLDGSWLLRAPKALRTVRLDQTMGWPDLQASHGIAGVIDLPQGRYVHLLGDSGKVLLKLRRRPPSQPYLLQANAELRHWLVQGKRIRLRLAGFMPVRFSISKRCTLHLGKKKIEPERKGRAYQFRLQTRDTGHALLICR